MVTSGSGAPGSGEQSPRAGYYPDPSIPGYVRYWNGSAWVPGSSRPEPAPGEVLSPPPDALAGGPSAAHAPAPPAAPLAPGPRSAAGPGAPDPRNPLAPSARTPGLEESGPMFLDEDPHAPVAHIAGEPAEPAVPAQPAAGSAPAARPGAPASPAAPAASAAPAPPVAPGGASLPGVPGTGQGGYGYPGRGAPGGYGYPAAGGGTAPAAGGYGYPNTPGGGGYGYPRAAAGGSTPAGSAADPGDGASWQRQVQELARKESGPGVPGQTRGAEQDGNAHVPWRPPVSDPFLLAAQEQARPAALGRRLAARIVDSLLVGAVVAAATTPLAIASLRHIQHKIDAARQTGEMVQVWLIDGTTGLYLGIVLAVVLLTGLLYEALPTAKWGRTLGKKLLGLRVLDIESQLTPRFGQALRRTLVHYVLQSVAVGVLDALWCLFDRPWRQTWHDKAARTFVAGG